MINLARKLARSTAELTCATVCRADRADLLVTEDDGARHPAQRAASCLLDPQPGDRVLVAHSSAGSAHITAVLEREGQSPARLGFEDGVEICAPEGGVGITARDEVRVRSTRKIEIGAPKLDLSAQVGQLMVENLSVAGKVARIGVEQAQLVARSADAVVDRVVESFKSRLCKVEWLDRLQAKVLQQDVDGIHAMSTGYTVLRARKDVKIDGEQIIVG